MDRFTIGNLSKAIDISCVKPNHTVHDLDQMIAAAKKYGFICAFALPGMTPYLAEHLKGKSNTMIGGTVGFPSGCDTTESKVFQTRELLSMGCDELDMVINIAQLKSQNHEFVYQDIKAVVDAAGGIPVKTILEVALLTNEEIVTACRIAEHAGTSYIKTGTGWCSEPTLVDHIKLIKSVIQPRTKIKAAGGIRNLTGLLEMKKAGCDRFGISVDSAMHIMEEAVSFPGLPDIFP
ncbi:deoxyribose-phosphate aldolase [Clostridium sp. Marseille-P2415]|uniref:deoxyribose-phosphate aldolase n=1 Tax=Clostridium sp. Marseille-P2415 TaxID=1805471 RepID=UPI0009886385|nr:deoxyribose-phosphate aldolase [Clostridium sp. Marseille-P2415]